MRSCKNWRLRSPFLLIFASLQPRSAQIIDNTFRRFGFRFSRISLLKACFFTRQAFLFRSKPINYKINRNIFQFLFVVWKFFLLLMRR